MKTECISQNTVFFQAQYSAASTSNSEGVNGVDTDDEDDDNAFKQTDNIFQMVGVWLID